MIAKSTTILLVDGLATSLGGSVASPWLDITGAVAATTHIEAQFVSVGQGANPELIIEVADDRLGTNAAKVLRAAGTSAIAPAITRLRHRHALTDRFIRVRANNPGTTPNATLTLNAQVDRVDNIG